MNEYETMKDKTAMGELQVIIAELNALLAKGQSNIGKCRPIIGAAEIELIKDHLDLVIKYTKL